MKGIARLSHRLNTLFPVLDLIRKITDEKCRDSFSGLYS